MRQADRQAGRRIETEADRKTQKSCTILNLKHREKRRRSKEETDRQTDRQTETERKRG